MWIVFKGIFNGVCFFTFQQLCHNKHPSVIFSGRLVLHYMAVFSILWWNAEVANSFEGFYIKLEDTGT